MNPRVHHEKTDKNRLFCFGNFFSINFLTKLNSNKKNVGVTDCSNSRKTFRERH